MQISSGLGPTPPGGALCKRVGGLARSPRDNSGETGIGGLRDLPVFRGLPIEPSHRPIGPPIVLKTVERARRAIRAEWRRFAGG